MLQAILDAVRNVGSSLFNWEKALLMYFWGFIWGQISSLMGDIPFPTLTIPAWPAQFLAFCAMANYWIPLSESVTLVGIFFTVWIVWMPVKIILRHLPVIGG